MSGISKPKINLSITPAQQIAGLTEQRVLLVGQLLAAGSASDGDLTRDMPNDGTEDALFGQTSHIAMIVRDFKKINQVSAVDVLSLADGGSAVKGTGVITLASGPSTADATIFVTIGSKKNLRVQVDTTSGDAITAIGDAIVAAYALLLDKPFTIANAIGVVTATAENGGTLANEWGLVVEGTIPGVTIALTGWTGGATDPTLTSILDVIGTTRYQTVLWPSVYDLSVIETLLDARFNTANDVLDGIAMQVKTDTLSNLKTYANQNSQSVVIPSQKVIADAFYKGPSSMEFPDSASAQLCAIRSLRLTNDAVLTQFLTTVSSDDQFGGRSLASLPYFNTALPNISPGDPANQFSETDMDELSSNGLSLYGPNKAFNETIFGEFVTTSLTDTAGNPDTSFKFLNTVDTISAIREFYFVNLKSRYAQTRLTDGDLVAGRDMANEGSIIAFCNRLYDILAEDAITQKGAAAKKDYNLNLIVAVDVSTGTVTINQAPLLVSQLRAIIGTIQINFGG